MNELYHEGTPQNFTNDPHGSGRFRQGTGDNPFQHHTSLEATIYKLQQQGITSEKDIATALGMSVNEYRQQKSIDRKEKLAEQDAYIFKLRDAGFSPRAIAAKIGKDPKTGESYVRYRLNSHVQAKAKEIDTTAELLKESLKEHKYIDITAGSEVLLGIKKTKLDTAVRQLVNSGEYDTEEIKVRQAANPDQYTTVKVIGPKGLTKRDVYNERDQIGLVTNFYKDDGTRSIRGIKKPASVDESRVFIRYAEDGGINKDGVIELRRNVPDLDLGTKHYAQVRIGVNDTHYLKGMALYSDDIPEGYDIVFNTNKKRGTPMLGDKKSSVLKPMNRGKDGEIDWDNPFKSSLKMEEGRIVGQREYTDKDGSTKLSALNIVREEGDWEKWSKTLASQFLAKQPIELINQQLDITFLKKQNELSEIEAIGNNELKRKMLTDFADECDSAACHLKAAALPRQTSKVILPVVNIKPTEIYAPTYRTGEKVALIRYPHGGRFEIPILTVNNRNVEGKKNIGPQSIDAVGIHPTAASQLSGADFDGDTVVVIPIEGQNIKALPVLEGLKDFEPKTKYPYHEGMKVMKNTQNEMGIISNLIMDMTIQNAPLEDIARAVRHSMVVIDAEKHRLDYKASERAERIDDLKAKYQGGGGASTLLTLAKNEATVPDFRKKGIDPETGAIIYEPTGKTKLKRKVSKRTGDVTYVEVEKQVKVPKMKLVSDARELMSGPNHEGTAEERAYANYANKLKSMANNARKESLSIPNIVVSQQAREIYKDEVDSINAKIELALANRPLERMAQIIANVEIENAKKDYPELRTPQGRDDLKKLSNQLLAEARRRTGASKTKAMQKLTPKEWEAIEAGIFTSSKLKQLFDNTDMDRVKELAMPKERKELTSSQVRLIEALAKGNYDISDIADAVGVSASTVSRYLTDSPSDGGTK